MDPAVVSAIIGGMATVITAIVGGYRAKISNLKHDAEKLDSKIEKQQTALELKDETIGELRSQRDKLQVTAELQDKIWSQIERRSDRERDKQ